MDMLTKREHPASDPHSFADLAKSEKTEYDIQLFGFGTRLHTRQGTSAMAGIISISYQGSTNLDRFGKLRDCSRCNIG